MRVSITDIIAIGMHLSAQRAVCISHDVALMEGANSAVLLADLSLEG